MVTHKLLVCMTRKETMYNRIILLVIDGFGVGEMDDCKQVRPNDVGSNTALHVLQKNKHHDYPNLRKLGLYDLLHLETNNIPYIVGKSNLKHYGADSYFGHQEIMGTKPEAPKISTFDKSIEDIKRTLEKNNINYYEYGNEKQLLVVEGCFTIGDNIETDPGQAFNVTADLNKLEFSKVVEIAKIVREVIQVPRLIVFGSKDTSLSNILDAVEETEETIGVNAPKSGVYTDTYECVHIGYGVDYTKQCAQKLINNNVHTTLIGKAADVITCLGAKYIPMVDTQHVMDAIINEMTLETKFIFANVQETDLAGHMQDEIKLGNKLKIVDSKLNVVFEKMQTNDLLIVMADHGDDPSIGHPMHTREQVPILIYSPENTKQLNISQLDTMADIGATIFYNFTGELLEYGNPIGVIFN